MTRVFGNNFTWLGISNESTTAKAWRWWISELRDCLPARVRRLPQGRPAELAVFIGNEGYVLYQLAVSSDRTQLAAAKDASELAQLLKQRQIRRIGRAGAALVLARQKYLLRTVELPKPALSRLNEIFALDIERITPFKAPDVVSAAHVDPASKDNVAEVGHLIARREDLDPCIAVVLGNKLPLKGFFAETAPGEWTAFEPVEPLHRTDSRARAWIGRAQRIAIATAVACCALAAFVYDYKLGATAAALDEEIQILRNRAAEVGRRFEEIQSSTETMSALGKRRTELPTTIAMIDELTRLMPDTAWVQTLTIDKDELSANVEAANSVQLLQLIEQSPIFRNARFTSPVSKDAGGKMETFSLGFERQRLELASGSSP